MRRLFAESGVPAPTDREIMRQVGEPFSVFLAWAIACGLAEDRHALARRITEAEYASIEAHGELFPGVVETLENLAARNHTLALCTNGDQAYVRVIFRRFGLGRLFDEIRTHEDEKKPKRVMVSELRAHWPRHRPFVIGDRYHDVQAGRENGCTVIGAAYGYAAPGELDDADHRIGAFDEIPPLVD